MVAQRALSHRIALGRYDLAEHRIAQGGGRDLCQLMGGCIMRFAGKAVGIVEMRIRQAKLGRLCIHFFYKHIKSAAFASDCHRRVIAGFQHQPVQRIPQGQLFPFLQVHRRAFDSGIFLFHRVFPIQIALAQCDKGGHDLCCGRHWQACVAILFQQHLAGIRVHHNRALRAERPRIGQQQQTEQYPAPQFLHVRTSPLQNKTYSAFV